MRRSSLSSESAAQITCPSVDGVKPRLAAEIAFSTAMDHRPVPDLHADQARLGHADGRELIERHVAAVGLDLHRIEQMPPTRGRCASRRARA